jgi:hypothetical protein
LPYQASFAKEIARSKDRNDRFFALLGDNGDFDLALLDVENSIRRLSLREDNLILLVFEMVLPPSALARNALGSKGAFRSRLIAELPKSLKKRGKMWRPNAL